MKFFTDKRISKKIIILILFIMTLNFLTPICPVVHANFGGALFTPVCELLQGLADGVIKFLQHMFMGDWDIMSRSPGSDHFRSKDFKIKYGPATIFSNSVPGLDVNFINPQYPQGKSFKKEGDTWNHEASFGNLSEKGVGPHATEYYISHRRGPENCRNTSKMTFNQNCYVPRVISMRWTAKSS